MSAPCVLFRPPARKKQAKGYVGKGRWEEKEKLCMERPAESQGVVGAFGRSTVHVKEKEFRDPTDGLE